MTRPTNLPRPWRSRARRLIAGASIVVLVLLAGCGDGSGPARVQATTAAPLAGSTLVSPAAFERRIATAGVVTINVHVPDEGSIPGTDLTIPYTDISTTDALPADRSTPLAVYCRSGNMSASAVRDLTALGYTDIAELDGGFNAWKASGRSLEAP